MIGRRSLLLLGAGAVLGLAAALLRVVGCLAPAERYDDGVVFQSDWTTDTGPSRNAVRDGGRWKNYWEFNGGRPGQLLSVVPGASVNAPGGRNALKVVQRGTSGYAANVQQDKVVPPSTDYYVRFYMRNDDTSQQGDHVVTVDTWEYPNLTFVRKSSSSTSWQPISSFYGCGYVYPIGHWYSAKRLALGAWYRFEFWVHYVDATHIQVHPRVYDASNVLVLTESDYRQEDFGLQVWNGRSDWTLATYYAAGLTFCVQDYVASHSGGRSITNFGMGNNGNSSATDTGLFWYFAAVQIRDDTWAGPIGGPSVAPGAPSGVMIQ